jgi:hypothetical protein
MTTSSMIVSLLCTLSASAFVVQNPHHHLHDLATKNVGSSSNTATFYGSDSYHDENSMTPQRKERLSREEAIQKRFAAGNELKILRSDVQHLRENLKWAEAMNDEVRVNDLMQAIEKGESRDPDRVYTKSLKILAELQQASLTKMPDKEALKEQWSKVAMEARSCIPRFQLYGLWIGR